MTLDPLLLVRGGGLLISFTINIASLFRERGWWCEGRRTLLEIFDVLLMVNMAVCGVGLLLLTVGSRRGVLAVCAPIIVSPLMLMHLSFLPRNRLEMLGMLFFPLALSVVSGESELAFRLSLAAALLALTLLHTRVRTDRNWPLVSTTGLCILWLLGTGGSVVVECISWTAFCLATLGSVFVLQRDSQFWQGHLPAPALAMLTNEGRETAGAVCASGASVFSDFAYRFHDLYIDFINISIESPIASGGRSEVLLGKLDGRAVAIKVFRPLKIGREVLEQWTREVELNRRLSHPNIGLCLGISVAPPWAMVLFEYYEKNLIDFIVEDQPDRHVVLLLMLDIVRGTKYLHSKNIIHRDFKGENIMVDTRTLSAKIIDLGESRFYEHIAMTIVGTPQYLAPEMLRPGFGPGLALYDHKVDIYSLGILFWEMMHNFDDIFADDERIENILDSTRRGFRPDIDDSVSEDIANLIRSMWSENPVDRPSAEVIEMVIERTVSGPQSTS